MTRAVRFSPIFLAMMLSPATLVVECNQVGANPALASLELEAGGLNRVVDFSGNTLTYDVWAPDGATLVTLRAQTVKPGARVNYSLVGGTSSNGALGVGGGEIDLTIPTGPSTIRLDVTDGGVLRAYTLKVNPTCSTGQCNDANSCTTDVCNIYTSKCGFSVLADDTACNFSEPGDGLCLAGICNDACGNSVVDPGEECDDGGDSLTCNGPEAGNPAHCSFSACGDGYLNPVAGETCDEGGDTLACNGAQAGNPASCQPIVCGDGYLNGAGEECDDGNLVDLDGCESDCTIGGFCATDPIDCSGVHDCVATVVCDWTCDPLDSCDRCPGQNAPLPAGTPCSVGNAGTTGNVCAGNTQCVECLNSQNRGRCVGGSNDGEVCDPNTVPSECPSGNCLTNAANVYDNPLCDSTPNECLLAPSYCDSRVCQPRPQAADGTPCSLGECLAGVCQPAP